MRLRKRPHSFRLRSSASSNGGGRASGYTDTEFEEIAAIASRADSSGIDAWRVLTALGVDPLVLKARPRQPGQPNPGDLDCPDEIDSTWRKADVVRQSSEPRAGEGSRPQVG